MAPHTGQGNPLIDVTSLARSLAGPRAPVLLDVRWRLGGPPGAGAYRAGHLPGAVVVDLDRDEHPVAAHQALAPARSAILALIIAGMSSIRSAPSPKK